MIFLYHCYVKTENILQNLLFVITLDSTEDGDENNLSRR